MWMDARPPVVSFAALYERHVRDVFRFALALTGRIEDAEDLTSEAFCRIWATGADLRELTVRGYLVAIVRNLHRSAWRRERRLVPMSAETPAQAVDPLAAVELERVLNALDQLPAADREVLALRAEAGLSFGEIADLTGQSAEAVRVRVHRARKKLMEVLCRKT
jgi:RNA polymerase sigma-70 factor (ECF subfamily)